MSRQHPSLIGLLAVATTLAGSASAQSDGGALPLTQANPNADGAFLNKIRAAYRGGFNIKPRFKNAGGYAGTDYGSATGGGNHRYEDGYNLEDRDTREAGGHPPPYDNTTYYWAYHDKNAQVTTVGDDTFVTMNSFSSPAVNSTPKDDGAPLPGVELTYNGELGRWGRVRVGVEAAVGYMSFCIRDHQPLASNVRRVSDTYKLVGGVSILPESSLAGIANPVEPSGGPLLGNTPVSRAIDPNFGASVITGGRQFEGDIFSGRLGPYLEVPFCRRVSAIFSGGLAIVGVSSRFSYNETVSFNGPLTSRQGAGSYGHVQVGGFVSGSLNVMLTSRLGLFCGVQYQDVGIYSHHLNGKAAELDLSQAIFFTAGVTLEF